MIRAGEERHWGGRNGEFRGRGHGFRRCGIGRGRPNGGRSGVGAVARAVVVDHAKDSIKIANAQKRGFLVLAHRDDEIGEQGDDESCEDEASGLPALFVEHADGVAILRDENQNRAEAERAVQLIVTREDAGSDERDEHRSYGATKRADQVKRCEMRGMRLEAHEFAMAEHAANPEARAVDGDEYLHRQDCEGRIESVSHSAKGDAEKPQEKAATVPAGMVEAENETQEIESERDDPEKRDRGDILRNVIGDGEKKG